MTTNINQQLWRIAQRRFKRIDWDVPITSADIETLHRLLPARRQDEAIPEWLQRVMPNSRAASYYAVSTITRRAAADGKLSETMILESDDTKFRLTITQVDAQIQIKVEALGLAIEDFAQRNLELTSQLLSEHYRIKLALNSMAEGEVTLADDLQARQLLFSPDIRLIIRVI